MVAMTVRFLLRSHSSPEPARKMPGFMPEIFGPVISVYDKESR